MPEGFEGRTNPLSSTPEVIARGNRLFQKNCLECHGTEAKGDGPASTHLDPPPADLRKGGVLDDHSDAWIFWRISEGKHGTSMPAWRHALDEEDRWALIQFLRSLAPDGK